MFYMEKPTEPSPLDLLEWLQLDSVSNTLPFPFLKRSILLCWSRSLFLHDLEGTLLPHLEAEVWAYLLLASTEGSLIGKTSSNVELFFSSVWMQLALNRTPPRDITPSRPSLRQKSSSIFPSTVSSFSFTNVLEKEVSP